MKVQNKKAIYIAFTVCFLWGCSTTKPPSVSVKGVTHKAENAAVLPKAIFIKEVDISKPAPFFGLLKTDTGRKGASVVYQGGAGLAGLVAQVLVHAAIENEAQKQALQQAQKEANKILENYTDLISRNTLSFLMQNSVEELDLNTPTVSIIDAVSEGTDNNYLIIETLPIYYMSQDQKTILLEHQLKAYYADEPEKNIYQNMAEAISIKQDIDITANNNSWKNGDGTLFFKTTANLYLLSLDTLLKDMYKNLKSQVNESTHKYYIGEEKYYVRGRVLHEDCDYKVIRNLKGNILILQADSANEIQPAICLSQDQDYSET